MTKESYYAQCWCGKRMLATSVECSRCKEKKRNRQNQRKRQRNAHLVEDGRQKNPGYHITVGQGKFKDMEVSISLNRQRHGRWINLAEHLASAGWDKAMELGHDMEPLQDDTEPGTYVAMCQACERFIAVDLVEDKQVFGGVFDGECTGVPTWKPAARKSEYQLDSQSSGPGNEPAEGIAVNSRDISVSPALNEGKAWGKRYVGS